VRARHRSGQPFHKSEFSLDDERAKINHIKILHDKMGFSKKIFKKALGEFDREEYNNVKELFAKQIDEGRENTKKAMKGSFENSRKLINLG